jgi:transposase-like protein
LIWSCTSCCRSWSSRTGSSSGPDTGFRRWTVAAWLVYPLAWFVYTLARGAIVDRYP